jgi:ABC-type ATPase involved in cell division
MAEPLRGVVRLFGQEIYRLDYRIRQRMRAQIGFVHGYGGLLSNRSIRDNIALPASVHGGLTAVDEEALVNRTLNDFALDRVGGLLPHDVDGGTRWRACLARALVLSPRWLVLEGLGNWEMDRGRGKGWTQLLARHRLGQMATVICLPRKNPGFQTWFAEHEGKIVHYARSTSEMLERVRL